MSFSEQEMLIQEGLWMMGVVELSLSYAEAFELIDQLIECKEQGLSSDDRIVLHCASVNNVSSAKWSKFSLQRIVQVLSVSVEEKTGRRYEPSRIQKARALVEYYDLEHGMLE